MSRKKPDIYEREKQGYWEAYHRSPSLKDRYPQVTDIRVEMKFKDTDGGSSPESKQEKYSQESKAFFKIVCPYAECISGGFDLSPAIDKLVASHLNKLDDTIICQGWQDEERRGKHHCFL
ncbi:MAG: hypothetical protein PHY02_06615 [Phycisphaerae bacterium]|nr:hypothetical protein [Phycisphaerae bacterium]